MYVYNEVLHSNKNKDYDYTQLWISQINIEQKKPDKEYLLDDFIYVKSKYSVYWCILR